MTALDLKALAGLAHLVLVLALALFLPAWTVHYWQAWLFLGVFTAGVLTITIYLMKRDPALLERRVKAGPLAEHERLQKVLQSVAGLSFIAVFVVSALDRRFAWSSVPALVSLAGDVWVGLGLLLVFLVFKANSFASATIDAGDEQPVVSTGPYALVRHPMYAGSLLMLLGVPIALGSWWGLVAVMPLTAAIVVRLLHEERFLAEHLRGYAAYRHKVRHRLLPGVW